MIVCDIFASRYKNEMYLYVARAEGTKRVPEELLARLGELRLVTTLLLKHDLKLARADVVEVLRRLDQQGYYLQMPPSLSAADRDIAEEARA
jgi:hypothetical protein